VVDEQAFQISHDPNNEVKVEAEVLTVEEEGVGLSLTFEALKLLFVLVKWKND
jgi:hypothetical protein